MKLQSGPGYSADIAEDFPSSLLLLTMAFPGLNAWLSPKEIQGHEISRKAG